MTRPNEAANARPWNRPQAPRRILVMRLQAFGDTVITLPWLASLREQLPDTEIDFLVLERNADLPKSLKLFNRVFELKGDFAKMQFLSANLLLPKLVINRYDVVIDLQRNNISRWVRFCLHPKAWSEIERFSLSLAGEKFKSGIHAAGFTNIGVPSALPLKADRSVTILRNAGWNGKDKLIVLNPAGAFVTRNWPIESYVEFAKLWGEDSRFLFLGIERIKIKAEAISNAIGENRVINMVNTLSPSESFSVLKHAHLVISEDSGLMHMAWVQRIPTVALFGSSPSYWSAPMGSWTKCLDSSDLTCGNCLSETCRFGDVHCLTRISPEQVFNESKKLLAVAR